MTAAPSRTAPLRALAAVGAMLVLMLGSAGACGVGPARSVSTSVLADDMRDAVVADYDVFALEVRCPGRVDADEGTSFVCEVDLPGGTLRYDVVTTDSDGGLLFTARDAVVDVARVEGRIAQVYRRQVGRAVEVVCADSEVIVVDIDETFTCEATDRKGTTENVEVTALGLDGHVRIELEDGTTVTETEPTPVPTAPPPPGDAGGADGGADDDGNLPGEELPGE